MIEMGHGAVDADVDLALLLAVAHADVMVGCGLGGHLGHVIRKPLVVGDLDNAAALAKRIAEEGMTVQQDAAHHATGSGATGCWPCRRCRRQRHSPRAWSPRPARRWRCSRYSVSER